MLNPMHRMQKAVAFFNGSGFSPSVVLNNFVAVFCTR